MKHESKPVATFGDLVKVAGYGAELFAVEAYYFEYHHEPGASYLEVIYDLTCVYGESGYIIGEQSDVTLACKADYATLFLQTYSPAPSTEEKPAWMRDIYFAIGNGGETAMQTKKQPKVKAEKVPTTRELIDTLLDERNDVGSTDDFIPTQDVEYKQRRLDEIDAELKELTAG